MSNNTFVAQPSSSYPTPASHNSSGPKRKRLVKACDACHKSKRRCDGTAPCSNCYFASKDCRYTDASGRPVPAPNATKPERLARLPDIEQNVTSSSRPRPQPFPSGGFEALESAYSPRLGSEDPADTLANPRKRLRWEQESRTLAVSPNPPAAYATSSAVPPVYQQPGLVPSLIRELVNIFFAHCHPHRLIIHQLSFFTDLSLDRVPLYLVNAICALSAPLSRNPRLQTTPPRYAGQPFAHAARALLFDDGGKAIAQACLPMAQALCLLQLHELSVHISAEGHLPLFNLALRIIEDLEAWKVDSPISTSDMRQASLDRECAGRVYWLVHLTVSLSSAMFGQSLRITSSSSPTLRLPWDETCFELSAHSAIPVAEHINVPAPKTQFVSEFGHLVRLSVILTEIEKVSTDATPDPRFISDSETRLQEWAAGLAEHLVFSTTNLDQQVTMWETNSNTTAWCFAFMHILYACCVLALTDLKWRLHRGGAANESWIFDQVSVILAALGLRSRNSIFMGIVSKLLQYLPPLNRPSSGDATQVHAIRKQLESWVRSYEDLWGTRGEICAARRTGSHSSTDTSPASNFPEPHHPTNAPVQYPSLAQSINDLHLQGPGGSPYISKTAEINRMGARRWSGEALHDPGQRGRTPRPREGGSSQPLPSLKSSGLLETWGTPAVDDVPIAGPSRGAATTPMPVWVTSHSRTEHSTPVRRAASASATLTRQYRAGEHRSTSRSPTHTQTVPYPPSFNLQVSHPSDRNTLALPSNLPWLAGDPSDT